MAACSSLGSGGTLKDGCIQCLSHPLGALPSSPCLFPASGTKTALRIPLFALTPQLASSSFLVMSPARCPTRLWSKKLLLLTASLSVSKGQLTVRTQESHNQSAHMDAQCRGGGIHPVVKEMAVLQDPDVQCCATCQVP